MFNGIYAFLLLGSSIAIDQSCQQEGTLHLEPKNGHVNVYYDFPQDITLLKLGLPVQIKDTVTGDHISVLDSEIFLTNVNTDEKKTEAKFFPLSRSENAIYTPYIEADEAYAIYIPYIIPVKVRNNKNEWSDINQNCIILKIKDADSSVDKKNGFYFHSDSAKDLETIAKKGIHYHFSADTPQWLKALIEDTANNVFELFTTKMGVLKHQKKVIVSYTESDSSFYDGGVAGDVLIVRFGGNVWKSFDHGAYTQIKKFVVHEIFHFWNAPDHTVPSWFHEGSAEYASNYIISLSEREFNSNNAVTKLECMLLHGGSTSYLNPSWQARYVCGQAFWAGIFANSTDFFSFWRKKQETQNSTDLVFFQSNITLPIQQAANSLLLRDRDSTQRYGSYLNLIGPINLSKDAKSSHFKLLALRHLMASKCNGVVSFSDYPEYIQFYNQSGCSEPFAEPLPLIYKMNDLAINDDPFELLQSYLIGCKEKNQVTLSGKEHTFTIACEIPLQLSEKITISRQ